MWTIPNLLSLSRWVAVLPLAVAVVVGVNPFVLALIVVLLSLTDFLDGWLVRRSARKNDWLARHSKPTPAGAFLDEFGDKVFVLPLLLAIGWALGGALGTGLMLMALVNAGRDGYVTYLRQIKKRVLPSIKAAKCKTMLQMVAVVTLLAGLAGYVAMLWVGLALMAIATALSLYSLSVYARRK